MSAFVRKLRSSFFWVRPLSDRAVIAVATLGFGQKVAAPGTWGAFAGALFYAAFFARLHAVAYFACALLLLYAAAAFCDEAEKRLRQTDPGAVNLDEFAVMPLVYIGAESSGALPYWAVLIIGFAFFRVFDIFKPFGIARLQNLAGGVGVVADDVAAALAACVSLNAVLWAAARF